MKVPLKTKRYFTCPSCERGTFSVEHLFEMMSEHSRPQTAGPWFCDHCGSGWRIVCQLDGTIDVEKGGYGKGEAIRVRELLELEIPPQASRIRLLVEGMRFTAERQPDDDDGHQFYYEENTCPTNWMHDVVQIAIDGKTDPHGLARYVGHVRDLPPGKRSACNMHIDEAGNWVSEPHSEDEV